MRFLSFSVVFLAVFLFGCNKKETGTLFQFVDKSDSGLDFKNELFETEETNVITLEYFYNGGGVSVGDFNNDGLSDLFFTGNMVPNKLYLNEGDLEFEDVSEEANVGGGKRWKSGSAVVDINNDGLLDIYICATIALDSAFRRNMMLVNQGIKDGKPSFIDKAAEYGIDDASFSSNAGFLDYDNDGDLDLYVLTNSRQRGPVNYRPKVNDGTSVNTDKLYRNNGNGTFTNVSAEAGILCEGYGLGLAFLDVNKDGWTDIYVCNDYITNDVLYINSGQGTFTNQIDQYIKHQSKFAMGSDAADINNDGLLDLITVDMLPDNNLRKKTVITGSGYITYINDEKFGYAHQYVRNMLQVNNGNGTFSEVGQLSGVYQTEWSWSPLFADFDNDGLKDLIVTNGFPKDITDRDFISFREETLGIASVQQLLTEVPSVKVPNSAFKNKGNLAFEDVTKTWGLDQPSFSNGAAYADLDNDGDLDYVVNNVNDFVSLYENKLYTEKQKERPQNFLRVKLKGKSGNPSGFGAKVTLKCDGKLQFAEHTIYRGYISCVEDAVHFGLGKVSAIDTVLVTWPDGKVNVLSNVSPNQVLTIDYKDAVEAPRVNEKIQPYFSDLSAVTKLNYEHQEDSKIDFNIQRTLPKKYSQHGPALAVGDINGDGLEDVCIGGSVGFPGSVFIQNKDATFREIKNGFEKNKSREDAGLLLFDSDNDNDLDLFVTSGTYEFQTGAPELQNRLYRNDGKGNFKIDNNALPVLNSSAACVRSADFDQDGDLDLFVGGNISYGRYPYADSSYVLRNDMGRFSNVTKEVCPEVEGLGIINDAIWSDFDNDGRQDLIVVGEFVPVTFFKNDGAKLQRVSTTGVENFKGWFNSINGADFDSDGDMDYVVGNLGLNNNYSSSLEHPVRVCAKDFDNNGSIDPIVSCYVKSEDGSMKMYPIHFWDELNSQSPKFRRKFAKFKEFATTTTDKFFSEEDLKGALILEANYMKTSYIENLGNGKFQMTALPVEAQVAPVNGILTEDVDGDNLLDLILVGNDYGNEPTNGQYDAFIGLVLKGDGKGGFSPVRPTRSGISVMGDAKALVKIVRNKGFTFVASQNQDSLKVFGAGENTLNLFSPSPFDHAAELVFKDGKRQKIEFYYGSGYFSQSSRSISIPPGLEKMIIYNTKAKQKEINF